MRNTIVYVTHDQVEAMTLADRIVVLNHGLIQQVGTPLELYDTPANKFVASFIGSPSMNFIDGTIEMGDSAPQLRINPTLTLPVDPSITGLQSGAKVIYGVRPEAIVLCTPDAPGALPLDVTLIEPTGLSELIHGTLGGEKLSVYSMVRSGAAPGDRVWVTIDTGRVQVFEGGSQRRLAKQGEN